MEPMSAQGTWEHEDFAEYAEHSLTHDDVPATAVRAAAGRRLGRTAGKAVIVSKHKVKNPVSMDVPAADRGRRRQAGPVGGTPPAQLSHAAGSRGARWTRDGER